MGLAPLAPPIARADEAAHLPRDVEVGPGLAGRDAPQRLPDPPAEGRAPGRERQPVEAAPRAARRRSSPGAAPPPGAAAAFPSRSRPRPQSRATMAPSSSERVMSPSGVRMESCGMRGAEAVGAGGCDTARSPPSSRRQRPRGRARAADERRRVGHRQRTGAAAADIGGRGALDGALAGGGVVRRQGAPDPGRAAAPAPGRGAPARVRTRASAAGSPGGPATTTLAASVSRSDAASSAGMAARRVAAAGEGADRRLRGAAPAVVAGEVEEPRLHLRHQAVAGGGGVVARGAAAHQHVAGVGGGGEVARRHPARRSAAPPPPPIRWRAAGSPSSPVASNRASAARAMAAWSSSRPAAEAWPWRSACIRRPVRGRHARRPRCRRRAGRRRASPGRPNTAAGAGEGGDRQPVPVGQHLVVAPGRDAPGARGEQRGAAAGEGRLVGLAQASPAAAGGSGSCGLPNSPPPSTS